MSLDPVTASIDAVREIGGALIQHFFPDPAAAAAAQQKLAELEKAGELETLAQANDIVKGQLAINQVEAGSPNWFVAGWRPFVGWVSGCGFAYAAIFEPLARFVAQVMFRYAGAFPAIDTSMMLTVLIGMLGLAGARTLEKLKGAEGNR